MAFHTAAAATHPRARFPCKALLLEASVVPREEQLLPCQGQLAHVIPKVTSSTLTPVSLISSVRVTPSA
jgi:hypothetical protein